MRRQYQGGSLAGFIIIGVLLTLVLVGGLYGLNRYNAEQSKEVAAGDNDSSKDKPNDTLDKKSSEESKPKTDTPTDTSSNESKNDDKSSSSSSSDSSDKAQTDKQLPVTGPADAVAALVAVVLLSFATAHYIQSRSNRSH